jgi:hypothetical protein
MARSFGRTLSSLWGDESWCSLTPGAQRLHMMLTSQRAMTLAGTISLTAKRWTRYSANTTVADIERALYELSDAGWVMLDEETDEVVVPAVLSDDLNAGRLSSQVAKGFWSAWDAIDSRHLRRVVVGALGDDVWAKLEPLAPLDAVHYRRSSPIDTEPPPRTDRETHPPTESEASPPVETDRSSRIESNGRAPIDSTRARLSTVDLRSSMVDGRCDSSAPEDDPEPVEVVETSPPAPAVVDPTLAHARRLCVLLADSIADRDSKRPSISDAWVRDMERLMRIDGRAPEDVERVIRWLDRGADDVASFWQPNVRSPKKLREKWDQMREQHRRSTVGRGTRAARDDRAWEDGHTLLRAVGSDVNPIDLLTSRRNGQ